MQQRRSVNASRMSTSPTTRTSPTRTSPALCQTPATTSTSPVRQLHTPSRTQYSTSRNFDVSSILSCPTPRPPSRRPRPFSPTAATATTTYMPHSALNTPRPPTAIGRSSPPPPPPTNYRHHSSHPHHHHHHHQQQQQQQQHPQTITTTHIFDLSLLCDTLNRGGARGAAPVGLPQTIELDLTSIMNPRVISSSPRPPPTPLPPPMMQRPMSRMNGYSSSSGGGGVTPPPPMMMRPSSPMRPHPPMPPASSFYAQHHQHHQSPPPPPTPILRVISPASPPPPPPTLSQQPQQPPRIMTPHPAANGYPSLPPGLFDSFCLSLMMSGFFSPAAAAAASPYGYPMMPSYGSGMALSNPYYGSILPYGHHQAGVQHPLGLGVNMNIYCQ